MRDPRRPFWQPAANYYILASAVSGVFFFIAWGLLHDAGEEMPWISSGIGATTLLAAAVVLREIGLRNAVRRHARAKKLEDARVQTASLRALQGGARDAAKLTIEQNNLLVKEIRRKSDAARLLNRFSSSHREVFEMCTEYLALNENELKNVNPSSPRLAPLLRGRNLIGESQRYHLLRWAEIETRDLTADAQNRAEAADRIEAAQSALGVLRTALEFYPAEQSLLESHALLVELLVSIKIREWMDRAERAAFKGEYAQARSDYEEALFELASGSIDGPDRTEAIRHIRGEIDRLEGLPG